MTAARKAAPRDDDDHDDDVGYLDLARLARYSSLSISTLRRAIRDPTHPLPHRRVGGRVLIAKRAFDAWFDASGTRPARDHESRDPRDPVWPVRAFHK